MGAPYIYIYIYIYIYDISRLRVKPDPQELKGETDSMISLGVMLWKICTKINSIFKEVGDNRLL